MTAANLAMTPQALADENARLRSRLAEAEELLHAIRDGEVDALMIDGAEGPRIFTLQGLEAESNRFRGTILRHVGDAVLVTDPDDRIVYMNPAAERLYDTPASFALGRYLHEVHHEAPLGRSAREARSRALEAYGSWRGEVVHQRADGTTVPLEVHTTIFRDGTIHGTLVLARDITQRRRAEQARMRSEERMRLTVDAGRMATWEWDVDSGVATWNDRHFRMLGFEPHAVTPGFELWLSRVHAEDRERVAATLTDRVRTGGDFEMEFRVLGYDDAPCWVDSRGRVDRGGGSVRCHGVMMDIDTRKRAEATMRQNAALFAEIIEQAPGGVYVVDADFRMMAVNSEALPVFASVQSLLGRDLGEVMRTLWGVEVGAGVVDVFRRTLATGERYVSPRFEELRVDTGAIEAYEWETQRVTLPDGRFGVVCYFNDVTERKRVEQALRDADRRKDEFLATLAHELRNPLAPVRNAVHVLQLQGGDHPELRWASDVIDRQVQQMIRLIDDLMDVSRVNQGRMELRREHAWLGAVVGGAIETSRPLVEEGGHRLDVTMPASEVRVDCDPTRLAQVVLNLLNNAAKYTPHGGRITLAVTVAGADVELRVRDTGIGIPRESLPGIFGMFSQVEGALSRSHGGLGIGLFLVRRLVELHGGTIEARSDGPGQGSEFVVRLPIVVATDATEPPSGQAARAALPESHLRIAVVDDNEDAAISLAMLLELMGNTARIAHDGHAALQLVAEFQPQVVLLDIGLPGMNGYDAARAIRATDAGRHMLLVAVTGWGQLGDRQRAEAAGFDHHMVKPVDPQALMTLISSAGHAHA